MHIFCGGFLRKVDAGRTLAHQTILPWSLDRSCSIILQVERLLAKQITVGNFSESIFAAHGHNAVAHLKAARRHAQPHGSTRKKRHARLCSCRPQGRCAAMNGRTGAGGLLIGREICIEPDSADLMHAHVELFSCDLEQACLVPLPQFAFAGINRGCIIGMNRDPGIDGVIIRRTRFQSTCHLSDGWHDR